MATTKKSETTDNSADVLEAILDKLVGMEERITEMETRPSEPPKLFRNQPDVKAPVVHNRIPEGTVVKLKETAERYAALMNRLETLPPAAQDNITNNGVIGRVTDNFYENKKTGDHKYKIDFDDVGSVGVKLSDLEFVS